jgi:hypothetical protein
VLTLHSDELGNAWDTHISDFVATYKKINECGKKPENHQEMFKRRFPDRVAQGETPIQNKATPQEKTPAGSVGVVINHFSVETTNELKDTSIFQIVTTIMPQAPSKPLLSIPHKIPSLPNR